MIHPNQVTTEHKIIAIVAFIFVSLVGTKWLMKAAIEWKEKR